MADLIKKQKPLGNPVIAMFYIHCCTQYLFPKPLINALYIPFMYLLSIYDLSQFQIAQAIVNMQLTYSKVFFSNVSLRSNGTLFFTWM